MANEARRPTRWWLAWVVGVLVGIGGLVVGSLIGGAVLGSPSETDPKHQYLEIFGFGVSALLLVLWVRLKEGRPISSLGFRGTHRLRRFLGGFLIGALLMTLGVLIPTLLGQMASGISEHTLSGTAAILPLIPLLVVFAIQASTEEAVFRGYMLPMGMRQLPTWAAVVGTSVIFAALHVGAGVVGSINITLYAVFACLVVIQQGSLWWICGFHTGWNFFQGNVFGVPVSGNGEPTAIFTFGPTAGSNELVSGGAFGIEASVTGTVLLLAAIAVTSVALRRTRRAAAQVGAAPDATAASA
jgi:membrane protease YdiL (CAAX protease family)